MNVSSHYWSPFHANDCVFSRNEQQKVYLEKRKQQLKRRSLHRLYAHNFSAKPGKESTVPWSLQRPLHDTSALLYCFSLTRALVIWPHAYMLCLPWLSYKALKSNLKLQYLMWFTWTVTNNYCLVGLQSFLKCHHTVKLMREVMCGH